MTRVAASTAMGIERTQIGAVATALLLMRRAFIGDALAFDAAEAAAADSAASATIHTIVADIDATSAATDLFSRRADTAPVDTGARAAARSAGAAVAAVGSDVDAIIAARVALDRRRRAGLAFPRLTDCPWRAFDAAATTVVPIGDRSYAT